VLHPNDSIEHGDAEQGYESQTLEIENGIPRSQGDATSHRKWNVEENEQGQSDRSGAQE
jgi:hypothetical protein